MTGTAYTIEMLYFTYGSRVYYAGQEAQPCRHETRMADVTSDSVSLIESGPPLPKLW